MRAKELVEKLNELIKIHGEDILVYVYDHEYAEDYQLESDCISFSEEEISPHAFGYVTSPNRLTIRG